DVALGLVGQKAEGHVQRLGGDGPQSRVGERFVLPGDQPLAHPLRQVERNEQARPRALQPLLGHHNPNLCAGRSLKARDSQIDCSAMSAEFPRVEGVEHRFVDLNGLRVHLAEAGPTDSAKPPILLLHGWPQHWYMWRRVIGALRDERRLLAPDLRGFGWSEAPEHGYDGETFAADQVALLDALG